MQLYIKNMVCHRCKLVVEELLQAQGLHPVALSLGEVTLQEDQLTYAQQQRLDAALRQVGFELIDDRKSRLIEKIKTAVISLVHHSEAPSPLKHSEYLARQLHYEYSYLSKLFSEVEGITIEHYIISQKIERVKELLVYDERSLSEIADMLGYSSVAHLSAQFKKITGLTPSFYKRNSGARRPLDDVR